MLTLKKQTKYTHKPSSATQQTTTKQQRRTTTTTIKSLKTKEKNRTKQYKWSNQMHRIDARTKTFGYFIKKSRKHNYSPNEPQKRRASKGLERRPKKHSCCSSCSVCLTLLSLQNSLFYANIQDQTTTNTQEPENTRTQS